MICVFMSTNRNVLKELIDNVLLNFEYVNKYIIKNRTIVYKDEYAHLKIDYICWSLQDIQNWIILSKKCFKTYYYVKNTELFHLETNRTLLNIEEFSLDKSNIHITV